MIEKILQASNRKKTDLKAIQQSGLPVVMYGAGSYAADVTKFLNKHNIEITKYCVDSAYLKPGQKFLGNNIVSVENYYKKNPNSNVVIGFNDHIKARTSLANRGIKSNVYFFDAPHQLDFFDHDYIKKHQKEFQQTYEWLEDKQSKDIFIAFINAKISGDPSSLYPHVDFNQYFSDPIILSNQETLVDCGAYDGDTIFSFLKNSNQKYKKIYAFEPDADNYKKLVKNLKDAGINNVKVINKGTWSEKRTLSFSSDGNMAAIVETDGDSSVAVDTIDNVVGSASVTYIKMDIEGAELESLRGARKAICKNMPKLAICVYHKPEDLITIPQFIKQLNKDYKLYLRQHQLISWETVLYALPKAGPPKKSVT